MRSCHQSPFPFCCVEQGKYVGLSWRPFMASKAFKSLILQDSEHDNIHARRLMSMWCIYSALALRVSYALLGMPHTHHADSELATLARLQWLFSQKSRLVPVCLDCQHWSLYDTGCVAIVKHCVTHAPSCAAGFSGFNFCLMPLDLCCGKIADSVIRLLYMELSL